jgi:hypothetical protein
MLCPECESAPLIEGCQDILISRDGRCIRLRRVMGCFCPCGNNALLDANGQARVRAALKSTLAMADALPATALH